MSFPNFVPNITPYASGTLVVQVGLLNWQYILPTPVLTTGTYLIAFNQLDPPVNTGSSGSSYFTYTSGPGIDGYTVSVGNVFTGPTPSPPFSTSLQLGGYLSLYNMTTAPATIQWFIYKF